MATADDDALARLRTLVGWALAGGETGSERRHAAARAAVVTAARATLRARGQRAVGALFAAPPNGPAWPGSPVPFAVLGACYPHLLPAATRKHRGSWFTLPALAGPTVARTLRQFDGDGKPRRICDPAVGAGAFLLAALRHRVAAGHRARTVAAEELFGVDLDPTAAQLAALTLHEACGDDAPPLGAIARHVRQGDGLRAFADATFDAVVGNPPWETLQRGRDDARGDDGDAHGRRVLRARFDDQGRGKLYTYRLFVERALRLLRPGGRLGLLVPASLFFDRDAEPLRRRLLDDCRWEWLFAFENRRRLFAIDTRYRFGTIVAERGGRTNAVRAAFQREDPADWAALRPRHLPYARRDLRALSPSSGAFVAVDDARDLDLLRRMAAAGQPLLGPDGACTWRQGDFNMTSDRHRFRGRAAAERAGYRADGDGRWRRGDGDPVLQPLIQGAMLGDLHPNRGAFAGGSGRGVRWRAPTAERALEPQYLVRAHDGAATAPARVALRALSNATNARTAIACLLADEPCGNSIGVLTPRIDSATPVAAAAFAAAVLGSLVWDWALRRRLMGTNLNAFVLADTVLPRADAGEQRVIAAMALQLCAVMPWHADLWSRARAEGWIAPRLRPARTAGARRQLLAQLDVAVARAFGLDVGDLAWMLRGCEHPVGLLRHPPSTRALDPKGFWRVDRDLPPSLRRPVLALRAAADALPEPVSRRARRADARPAPTRRRSGRARSDRGA